ncbi:daptide biosynthesis RiPP recognition protein [Microbacterium sp. NPDC089320]|uniref:daptide biosynthesis RiPP recognition protein n=1 Tax=Microbacterium sp. NPDC089320 TaxID=3155182 RepID=UPI003435393B
MVRDGGDAGSVLMGARALREWAAGGGGVFSRVFLVESGAHADRVAEVAVEGDVVLLPADSGPWEGVARCVRYSGALRETGDELFLGDRGVELEDYVTAAFVQIIGPTVVCLVDGSSSRAFLADAELARRTGVFPSALLDQRVLLANRDALLEPGELEPPRAVRVCANGSVSVGVRGDVIGVVDELRSVLAAPVPRAMALGEAAATLTSAFDAITPARIGRYLAATDLLKALTLSNGTARICGFGWALIDDGFADAEPLTTDPFLLDTADGLLLADITTRRRQLLTPASAAVVAVVQTSSTVDIAVDRVAGELRVDAATARALCDQAVAALAVHLGGRVPAPSSLHGVRT